MPIALKPEMARQIEQRGSNRAGSANDEDRCFARQAAVAGEHLVGGEVGQRNAHRLGGIDAIGDRHEKRRWEDRILCVSTDDTEIGNQLPGEFGRDVGSGRLDDADKFVTRGERQWSLEIGIAAASDEGIGETGAGSEHLDADLAWTGVGNSLLFRQLQDLRAAEASDTNVLPCHAANIATVSYPVARACPDRDKPCRFAWLCGRQS